MLVFNVGVPMAPKDSSLRLKADTLLDCKELFVVLVTGSVTNVEVNFFICSQFRLSMVSNLFFIC